MDKTQANAIAQAILEPDIKGQEETRRKRPYRAARLAARRRLAWFGLAGFAVGAAIGHFAVDRIFLYGLIGAFAAVFVGRILGVRNIISFHGETRWLANSFKPSPLRSAAGIWRWACTGNFR